MIQYCKSHLHAIVYSHWLETFNTLPMALAIEWYVLHITRDIRTNRMIDNLLRTRVKASLFLL